MVKEQSTTDNIELICADCLDAMRRMEPDTFDAIVTDPPYGLSFMGKEWDSFGCDTRQPGDGHYTKVDNPNGRSKVRYGYGNKLRDSMASFQEAMTPVFTEALRVSKPGAHLLCFGGTRTYHRMACAIEDAGWEVRDCIMWVYGSGFPKSMDVAKAIDKASGYVGEVIGERTVDVGMQGGNMHAGRKQQQQQQVRSLSEQASEWKGWGTALKPAWEPIVIARKPLDGTVANNVLTWGCGAMNIDACRVPVGIDDEVFVKNPHTKSKGSDAYGTNCYGKYNATNRDYDPSNGRFPANLAHDGSDDVLMLFPDTGKSSGGGGVKYVGKDVYCGGYTGKNYEGNVGMGDSGNAGRYFNTFRAGEDSADRTYADKGGTNFAAKPGMRRESTSADRFFYCAKASKADRGEGNDHPTVKPNRLMRWLVRLVCPRGGVVLDPFMGSGSTGVACLDEGMRFVGIDRDEHYVDIARTRMDGRQLTLC